MASLLATALATNSIAPNSNGPRVGVIGSGIGGAATAHYLKQQLPGAAVTVFEATDRVGGRLLHHEQDGVHLELGGTFFNSHLNPHLAGLIKAMSMPTHSLMPNLLAQDAWILNGSCGTSCTPMRLRHRHLLGDLASVLIHEGIPFERTLAAARHFSKALKSTLNRLEHGQAFRSLTELLSWDGLEEFAHVNTTSLLAQFGVPPAFMKTILSAFTNVIYTQGCTVSAFVMLSVICMFVEPAFPSFTALGNDVLVQQLLRASNASLLVQSRVRSIASVAPMKGAPAPVPHYSPMAAVEGRLGRSHPGYLVTYESEPSAAELASAAIIGVAAGAMERPATTKTEHFDAVVIATPLESAKLDLSHVANLVHTAGIRRNYVSVHVTVVSGNLRGSFFGDSAMAQASLITAPTASSLADGIHFVWRVGDANASASEGAGVYLLHSKDEVNDTVVGSAFSHVTKVARHYWPAAYPQELPTSASNESMTRPPILLDGAGLFYNNAMESIESAMEISSLSANNIVSLLREWWEEDHAK